MRKRRGGFTLLEILITIVIATIGLLGVLALITSTLRVAGDVVEDSFAVSLARSVFESVREGARNRAFVVEEDVSGKKRLVRGFVFVHEGVKEQAGSTNPSSASPPAAPTTWDATAATALTNLRRNDFVVFLPTIDPDATGTPGEPYFVFPRPKGVISVDETEKENKWPGTDDYLNPPQVGYGRQQVVYDVRRIYRLMDTKPTMTGPAPPPEATDQYGFAVVLRRAGAPALVDASGAPLGWATSTALSTSTFPPRDLGPRDGLYRVEVRVYRNFEPDVKSRHHEPVTGGIFVGLVACGS